jgi:hypothetical protein
VTPDEMTLKRIAVVMERTGSMKKWNACKAKVWMPDINSNSLVVINGQATPFEDGVQIFRWDSVKHKSDTKKPRPEYRYWLHYGFRRNTGHFDTYNKAAMWYKRGGR